jgi:hypothetical protein
MYKNSHSNDLSLRFPLNSGLYRVNVLAIKVKLKTILLLLGAGVIRYAVDKDYTLACAVLVGLVVDFSGKIFITCTLLLCLSTIFLIAAFSVSLCWRVLLDFVKQIKKLFTTNN